MTSPTMLAKAQVELSVRCQMARLCSGMIIVKMTRPPAKMLMVSNQSQRV